MAGGASSLALDVGLALLLVLMAGAMAGLTIGLLGMSNLELEMKCEAGDARAIKIWPIKRDHHRLLVTLVVANAFASEALPLAIDRFTPSPLLSLLASVLLILFFGEILPSALFSGSRQLALAAFFIPLVRILMIILAPINIPLAMLLDRTMGKEGMHTRFQRNQLRNLVALHARATAAQRPSSSAPSPSSSSSLWAGRARAYKSIVEKSPPQLLGTDEAHIIQQTLKLHRETAQSIMTELAEVRMINFESLLDTETMARIIGMGHSRLPVYRGGDRRNVVGLLLVKNLIVVDPSEERPLSTIPLRAPLAIAPDYDLFSLLNLFQVGRGGHFAVITDQPDDLAHAWNHGTDVPDHVNVLGCVTLEDVIEELLGEAVFDETDFREHILINVLPSLREALNNHGSDSSSHRGKERVYATVVRCALHWYHVTRSRRRRRLKAKSLSLKPTNSAREGADERDDDQGAADERTSLLKPEVRRVW